MEKNTKKIRQIILQPEKNLDEIITNIDNVINYTVHGEKYIDPEISITKISRALSMRSLELHLAHWKMLKAQLSMVEAHIEPERHEKINFLSKKVLKALMESLKNVLDYEKCTFYSKENLFYLDKSLLDEELVV